jgi:hypothetical protein
MSKKLKFVVISEPYDEKRGGSIVLHKLAQKLFEYGDEVYITGETICEGVKNLDKHKHILNNTKDYVFICSETHKFNKDLNPSNIVRWILYKIGFFNGSEGFYEPKEKIYQYNGFFTKNTIYKNSKELVYFEPNIDKFFNKGINRKKEDCILIKKGQSKNIIKNGLILDDIIYSNSFKSIDEIMFDKFNEYERFISYDTSTYHSIQAALCGCISIVIPEEGVSKEDWIKNQPLLKYGVAYGFDDIEWAISTQNMVRDHLINYYQHCIKTIEDFRKDCMLNFPNKNYFSIIINTRWQSLKILKLIEKLNKCNLVDEIILIDSNPDESIDTSKYEKVRYFEYEYRYKNESINFGVDQCTNDLICYCDDSVDFDCDEVLEWIINNRDGLGCVGINPKSFYHENDQIGVHKICSNDELSELKNKGFDKILFFKKSNFINIPEDLKVEYSTEWISKTNKPVYALNSKSRILTYVKSKESNVNHPGEYEYFRTRDDSIWSRINQNL